MRLAAFFVLRFPSFILSCGFGGWCSNSCIVRNVFSSTWGLAFCMSDSPSQVSADFLILIGRIVIGWGRVERAILISVGAGKRLIPNHFRKGRPPQGLAASVKALRALCEQLPSFVGKTKWFDSLLAEILEVADVRNTIIHGYFHGISGEAEPQIYFRKAVPLSGDAGTRVLATRQEMEAVVARIKKADHNLMFVMMAVVQDLRKGPEKAE
jgi:hypothetical protein